MKNRKMNLNDLEQKLKKEIIKTEKLIIEYQELTQPVAPDVAIGRISRMDAINNKSVAEAALRQTEDKLSNLRRVLETELSNSDNEDKMKKIFPEIQLLYRELEKEILKNGC